MDNFPLCVSGEIAPGSSALSADSRAGGHECEIMTYSTAASARRAIGPARLLWQTVAMDVNDEQGVGGGQGSKSRRALWVWLHPAAAEQFEEEVMGVVRRLALRVECENLR